MNARFFILPALAGAILAAAAARAQGPGYPLKNRSSFEADPSGRNPFWPIGYTGGEDVAPAPEAPVATLQASDFAVTSILAGGGVALAVVNGRECGIGDMVVVNGARSDIRVAAILDGAVVLTRGREKVTVPLRRRTVSGEQTSRRGEELPPAAPREVRPPLPAP